ncbi:F0F1 ATP synthase subunit delta [Paenisporosarcina cavernae]|uniref:ATP synthase subunit delta n=1 Tax=Paenisporosarcina cavernae TaxID=2320858 RepID=A0A385YQR1_9BACL|nr:F0F1 ATP synthase subunit delta [Paenisporosarcina cavernae]AYC28834.1 F0F1 ATP synthase subunit delta [Paenisporosarcina cavernae]
MSKSQAAKRYALALFQLAQEKNQLAFIEEDLREVKVVFQENPELLNVFHSPKFSLDKKKQILSELFANANPFVLNTLKVLVDARRIGETVEVANEFATLSNDFQGIADAKVYSTRPLTDEERASISTAFAKQVGKQALRIENEIDPSLIGGIRLQIGGRIFDSSISAKLDRLKKELIG